MQTTEITKTYNYNIDIFFFFLIKEETSIIEKTEYNKLRDKKSVLSRLMRKRTIRELSKVQRSNLYIIQVTTNDLLRGGGVV